MILIPLIACIPIALTKDKWEIGGYISFISLLVSAITLIIHYPSSRIVETVPWAPELGINLTLMVDWLSYPFGIIVLSVSCLAAYYSISYMKGRENLHIYFLALNLFAVSMLGVVLSVNMIMFYLFWDLMLVASYFLITEWGEESAKEIGLQYFVYMSIAAVFLLLGLTWLHATTETYNFLEMTPVHSMVYLPLILSFLIKQGVFPVHGWLPDAHSVAPIPISIMLSGLMVNIGGYGLVRFFSLFPGKMGPFIVYLFIIAVITVILGALMVLRQDHIKRVLAWSTVSQGGYIIFGAAALTTLGLRGAGFHLVTQAITKGLLFMVAGAIILATGKRYLSKMDRLMDKAPLLVILSFLGFFSLAGVPGLASFQSEWMIFTGGAAYPVVDSLMLFGTVLTLSYCLWFLHSTFFTKKEEMELKKIPLKIKISMIILGIAVVLIGVYPTPLWIGG